MERKLRILVVDDSPEDRELYRRLFAAGGFSQLEIVERETGTAGLASLGDDFDCVLLDYRLPDFDGLEFLDRVGTEPGRLPVILLTGQGDEKIAVESMKRGARDYLVKGRIRGEDLVRSVQHAMEKVALERKIAQRSDEIEQANRELSRQMEERRRAQDQLRGAHDRLEELVLQRTRELERANEELRREVGERRRAEEEKARLLASEQSARREAEEASRLKDEFLATLSHELRTPLNAVLGWAPILRTGRLDEATTQRALDAIERNARAQAQLIADLLDVSGIITGKMRLELQPLELSQVLRAVEDTARPAAEAKGIELKLETPPVPSVVLGDTGRLQQIVWNLVANAVKFTAEGGHVRVRSRTLGHQVEIEVTDDGIGIAAEFLPFVFDRFSQRDSSTTRRHGGLGLGLAIVRHLVELHGGSVSAESEGEGRGATFRVVLPARARVRAQPLKTADEPHTTPSNVLAGLRILVVDDESDTRELCRTVLVSKGARVELASSSASALECVERHPPDILLADIGLPDEDGYVLLQRIRGLPDDRGANVPAVAITAYASADDARRALAAGYDLHLPKPFDPDRLVAAVLELVHPNAERPALPRGHRGETAPLNRDRAEGSSELPG